MAFKSFEKHWKSLLITSLFSVVFFILFLTLAMIFYPDGSSPTGYNGFDGYSFWKNFISDLGMTHTFQNSPNTLSPVFLGFGITILSIGGSVFYLLAYSIFNEESVAIKRLSAIGSISGISGCIFLLGVSVFPKDADLELHEITSGLFFLLTFVALLVYNRLIFMRREISNRYTIAGYVFVICGLIYAIVPKLIFPQLDDEATFIFKPASQKIAVISLLVAMVNYMVMIKAFKSTQS